MPRYEGWASFICPISWGCDAIAAGRLRTVLDGYLGIPGQFSILWPWSRHLSPKVRVLVDFLSERLFVER